MKRIIVDYNKLTIDILDLLTEKFPDGYDYSDVLTFKNAKNKTVKAVEVRTEDTIYLVKISLELEDSMELHRENFDFESEEINSLEDDEISKESIDD